MSFLRSIYGKTLASHTRFLQALFLLLCPALVTGAAGRSIEETEAWRVAIFFFFFFILSFFLENIFHHIEHYLHSIHETGILGAVDKIKEELMLLGFISLMLVVFEDYLVQMCIEIPDKELAKQSIPCCNTRPNPKVVTLINNDLKECIGKYTFMDGDNNPFIAKVNISHVEKCNKKALEAWEEGSHPGAPELWFPSPGYVPAPYSDLMDVCAAPGQNPIKLISDKHDFECPRTADGKETAPFISVNAMHQLHTLIFLTAMAHIIYSALIMFVSQTRVRNWTRWETYGDDADETVDKLKTPPLYSNAFFAIVGNCFQQCCKSVDPLTYIAVRRYYIVRNNLPKDFDFNEQLIEVHRKDFKDLVGVSAWMWIVIILLVILDGVITSDARGLKMLNTFVAITCCLVVGCKLLFVFRDVVDGVLKKIGYDHDAIGSREVTKEEVDTLQYGQLADHKIFDDVDAHFWFHHWCCGKNKKCLGDNAPKFMLSLIRLTMFQNSYTVAQLTFYLFFVTDNVDITRTCFGMAREWYIFAIQLVAVIAMFALNGLVTVPLFSICAITTHHNVHGSDLHKHFHTVSHTLKDELRIIQKTLSEGPPPPEEHNHDVAVSSLDGPEHEVSEPEPVPEKPSPLLNMTAFMFHAKEAMLKKRLEKTQRELDAMRTIRMHSMQKESESEALHKKNNKVAPEDHDEQKLSEDNLRRGSLMLSKESVSTVARAVKAISKLPIVQFVIYGLAMAIVIIVILMTPRHWWVDYGYYVPHWNYQGWGGPLYWKKLSNNADGHMDVYNNIKYRKEEWTVSHDDKKYVYQTGLDKGRCISAEECVSYKKCAEGKYQSPININVVSWAEDSLDENAKKGQFRNSDKKTLADLFTSDSQAQFFPYYLTDNTQLIFKCTSTSETNPCGLFKWNNKKYKVSHLKLHSPAEHTFDNIKAGMEMQIVMKEQDDDEAPHITLAVLFDVGVKKSKSITELGKLFGKSKQDITATGHPVYENLEFAKWENQAIFHKYRYQKETDMFKTMEKTDKVDLSNIVHAGSSFFHYMGSDTEPPCSEGKNGKDWFIQTDVVHMTEEQWQGIYRLFGYPGNARPTQDVERYSKRIVTYYGGKKPSDMPKSVTSLGVDWT